ncbi:AIPR family protein [Bosea sp. TAF32]|uniref:AIPR family protein n=1 Tax=Bosea sp. TAF32 TaxID=3237482 RepID=UPI003F8F7765
MAKISQIDWDIIDARVRSVSEARRLPNLSMAMLWLVLDQFFPQLEDETWESITDGPDDRGVDAIHIVEGDGHVEVYLFQSKYRETAAATDKTINDSEALKLSLFIEELFDKSEHLGKSGNLRLREAVNRIWKLHEDGIICRYRIVFCSNDRGISSSAREIIDRVCSKHLQVGFECYGPSELIRDLGSRDKHRETGYLQVVGREAFERTDGDVRGVIASVDAKSFVELIQTPDRRSVKRYLFDDNLRVFLGSNGGYNQSIISTATSSDSHLFWYLNNGITITCKNYSYNKGHVNPKIKIEDFQIVNGAQTSHSLVEASRLNSDSLENVILMVRVYATDRGDIAERVAVATNSQARIQSRDLRANHPVLKKLELAFAERGYFFERKRNMHSDRDVDLRIDALKLGQIIMTYYLREPERAKGESDSIFESRFNSIFHESYDVDDLCRIFKFHSAIENMRDAYIAKFGSSIERGGELQFLVYGHWFVLFAARLILAKDSRPIPVGEEAEALILQAIGVVARVCGQTKSVAHYQMFRSSRTKDKIMAEFSGRQSDFFDLLSGL